MAEPTPAAPPPPPPPDPRGEARRPHGPEPLRRPLGVVLIAALIGLNALSSFVALLALLAGYGPEIEEWMMAGTLPETVDPGAPVDAAQDIDIWTINLYLAIATIANAVILYGFWTLKRWGYWIVLVLSAVAAFFSILSFIAAFTVGFAIWDMIGALIAVAIVAYLARPRIKALFG